MPSTRSAGISVTYPSEFRVSLSSKVTAVNFSYWFGVYLSFDTAVFSVDRRRPLHSALSRRVRQYVGPAIAAISRSLCGVLPHASLQTMTVIQLLSVGSTISVSSVSGNAGEKRVAQRPLLPQMVDFVVEAFSLILHMHEPSN